MADAAIFVGWGQTVRGREAAALIVFNEAMTYFTGLQQAGTIESFEPVLLTPHGGDLAGFTLLRGERGKLDDMQATDEFQRLIIRANLIAENVGILDASIGASLQTSMTTFAVQSAELA